MRADGELGVSELVVEAGNAEGKERWRRGRRGSEREMESEVVMVKNGGKVLGVEGPKKDRVTRRETAVRSAEDSLRCVAQRTELLLLLLLWLIESLAGVTGLCCGVRFAVAGARGSPLVGAALNGFAFSGG